MRTKTNRPQVLEADAAIALVLSQSEKKDPILFRIVTIKLEFKVRIESLAVKTEVHHSQII
jgi:hypothetical protein